MKELMDEFSYCEVHNEVGLDYNSNEEQNSFEYNEKYQSPNLSFEIEDEYDPNKEDNDISIRNKNYISFNNNNNNNNLSSIKKSNDNLHLDSIKVSAYDDAN